nr:MAG: nonstructural protein 2 [Parvoviridae sp.]
MSEQWILCFQPAWLSMIADGKANNPHNWKILIQHVHTILEEANLTNLSDYDIFKEGSRKLIENWTVFEKKWSVDTFEKLMEKAGALLSNTIQKCISTDLKNSVLECLADFLSAHGDILEDSCSGPTKETTSTSCMIAPLAMDNAGASSANQKTFEESFEALCDASGSSPKWTPSTGRMYSYISYCPNGKANRKFGMD